jgi:predicted dehydrogenase
MAETLRIGFIGAGANTRSRHIPGLKAQPDVELAWVCNRSMESGQAVADQFGIAKVTTDPDDIYNDPTVGAVCIGTWPYMHKEYAVRALQAGKHVLCEARMAMNAAEGREMLAAARATDRVAQLVPGPYDLRCGPTITKLIREGYIGQPTDVLINVCNAGGLDAARTLAWRQRYDYSGHNTMSMGIFAEVILRWLGESDRVTASAKVYVNKRIDPDTGNEVDVKIPDSLTIAADMACGARATYLFSAVTPHAPRNSITVYGTEGCIALDAGGNDSMSVGKVGGQLEPRDPDAGLAGEWRVEADFVDSIRQGKPVTLTNFEDGVRYMEFTDAVWKSWNEGRAVDVAKL